MLSLLGDLVKDVQIYLFVELMRIYVDKSVVIPFPEVFGTIRLHVVRRHEVFESKILGNNVG
jgi:hypothetical protein